MSLSYSALREIQKKEMEGAAIVKLEDGFYAQVAELLAKKREEALSSQSIMAIRELENTRKTVISVQAKREEKIVLMALRGENEGIGLTPEERLFLQKFSEDITQMRSTVKGLWNSEEMAERNTPPAKKVRIIRDVERYIGLDKNVYGPFKPGEHCMLPKEEAEWLLSAKMAELV